MKWHFLAVAWIGVTCAQAQVNHPVPYDIGSTIVREIWVDPVLGNDARTGLTRGNALRSVTEAWNRIPQNATLTTTGYRIMLVAGHHTDVPNYWEARFGAQQFPVIVQSADGDGAAQIDTMNVFNCRYLYLLGVRLQNGGGDVLHLDSCQNVLVRNCTIVGTGDIFAFNSPQETMKVNQSEYLYVEGCDISGAWDNAVDCVAVHYGHFIGNRIHHTLDWCMYLKGGSAYITVDGNEFYDGRTGGFTAGQGTGFEFMESPWLHYEAEDIKFINNVVHHTGTAGIGVNGGYNILVAYNTLYKAGTNDHVIEIVHGRRGCDGSTSVCGANNSAGGWGTAGAEDQYIPSRNVYVFNNLIYNPAGSDSDWDQFVVNGATTPPPGSNVPNPSFADTNVRIRGNMIWNGSARLELNGGSGCGPGNPTCNDAQLLNDNTINSTEPQLIDPESGDFRPVVNGNVFSATTFSVPSFSGGDRPSPPTAPVGNLDNSVPADYLDTVRSGSGPPGAFAGPANIPPTVQITSPANGTLFHAPTNITVTATASDSDGVSGVDFYAGAALIGSDNAAPFSIVWTNPAPLLYALTARATDGLGASSVLAPVSIRMLGTNTAPVAYDFDGDRVSDVAVYWPDQGQWFELLSLSASLRQLGWGWSEATPAPADFDGDGITDVAVYHRAAGAWYILQSASASLRQLNWGWSEAIAVPGDYDGDGQADVAVFWPAGGNWYILQSSDGLLRQQNWGWSEVVPVPADYDGDGKTDIAVYHPASGNWYIFQSTDQSLRQVNWGWSEADPAPADFDGDGRADITVYHPAAGNWYILQSASSTLRLQGWGWSEAVPVPGDYDGDGRSDVAVYHQAAGDWYILESSGASLRRLNWGWNAAEPVQNQFHLNRGH